ncbi:acyl-CoA thioesterase [Nostoc sp. WHI]|nr:acyl-CoA thioesterase [Nostoc sp. WHI]MBG1266120.1 acyl-CoA thioesterase [Nostoc sp. WHI]
MCVKADTLSLCEDTTLVSLRPNDFDWSLQLNNSVFLELLEIGRWSWSLANGIDLRNHHLVGVVIRLEIDYLKPVFWDPTASLKIHTKADKIEYYSFYLQQSITNQDEVLVANAKLRLGLFDKNRRVPVVINIEEIQKLDTMT